MQYPITAANGDAGEFFFAYQIASVLKWSCRLFDIDIGIDAQVEVINDDRSSTGRFVAFQIKATSKEEADCRYISKRQLDYWRELDLPVFVVLVDLSDGAMYLHHVNVSGSYSATEKGRVRIDFDLQKDRFGAGSAQVIAEAATEGALLQVRKRLEAVQARTREMSTAVAAQDDHPNAAALIELMNDRDMYKRELAQSIAVAQSLRAGQAECEKAAQDFEKALQALRDRMRSWSMHLDWDEHGHIARFLEEGR